MTRLHHLGLVGRDFKTFPALDRSPAVLYGGCRCEDCARSDPQLVFLVGNRIQPDNLEQFLPETKPVGPALRSRGNKCDTNSSGKSCCTLQLGTIYYLLVRGYGIT